MVTFNRYHDLEFVLPPCIQGIWVLKNDMPVSLDIIPDGYPEIAIPIKGTINGEIAGVNIHTVEPTLIGQINAPFELNLSKNAFIIFLKIYPRYLGRLTQQKAKEFTNQFYPIQSIKRKELIECVEDFKNDIENGIEIKPSLKKLLKHSCFSLSESTHPILDFDQRRKFDLIRNLNPFINSLKPICSTRYLEKLYENEIGISPSQFFKILKVKKASILMARNEYDKLSELSDKLGYYDLSHLYKDFKSLSYKSPSQFIGNQTEFHLDNSYLQQWDYS